jgi:hypothetical protein
MEHRREPRVATDLLVRVSVPDGYPTIEGRLCNLSIGGAFVRATLNRQPSDRLKVLFDYRSALGICFHFTLEGRLLRGTTEGLGLEWASRQPAVLAALMRALETSPAQVGSANGAI